MKKIICILAMFILSTAISFAADAAWGPTPSISSASPSAGALVTVTGTFSVSGGGTLENLRVTGGVDSTVLFDNSYDSIRSGGSRTISFAWSSIAGAHTLWLQIDPDATTADTNSANNRWQYALTLVAEPTAPDLRFALSAFRFTPSTFNAGDRVNYHFAVMNIGSGDAGPFDVGLRVDGSVVASVHYDGLGAGMARAADIVWESAVCTEEVALVADCNNAVTESDEVNNVYTDERFRCDAHWHEMKNFYFENVTPDGSTRLIETDTPTMLRAILVYEGSLGSVTYNLNIHCGLVGSPPATINIRNIQLEGDSLIKRYPVSCKKILPAGTNTIFFEVDPDRSHAEINERDNRIEQGITVQPKRAGPIAAPSGLTITKTKPPGNISINITNKRELESTNFKVGKQINVKGTVKATGDPIARSVKIKATLTKQGTLSKALSKEQTISISPNSTASFSFTLKAAAMGLYKSTVFAEITDSNPADNSDSVKIKVEGLKIK